MEDYEEEPLLRTGCKEYFWLLCKLIDNIHVKDASQVRSSALSRDAAGSWLMRYLFAVLSWCFMELLLALVCLNSQKVSPSLSLAGAMQTTLLDLDALARHLADCIRRSDNPKQGLSLSPRMFPMKLCAADISHIICVYCENFKFRIWDP